MQPEIRQALKAKALEGSEEAAKLLIADERQERIDRLRRELFGE